MKIKTYLFASFLALFCFLSFQTFGQKTFPRNDVYDERDGHYVLTNATVFVAYNKKIENASLVIKKGKVLAVGQNLSIPSDAVQIDLAGKYIYPAFIDPYSSYGLEALQRNSRGGGRGSQIHVNPNKSAYSWNESMRSDYNAHEAFKINSKEAKDYLKNGFATVLAHRMDGISRGSGSLIALGQNSSHESILKENASHHLSFNKGTSSQSYPGSLMGGIALIRQTHLDGQWYQNGGKKEELNLSLAAWNELQDLPQIFEVRDKLEIIRASKIAAEFNQKYIFKGNGDSYQRIQEIKATGSSLIIPLKFPEAYDVSDPHDAMNVSLAQMMHWELASENAARIAKAGIPFAFTSHGLKKKSEYLANIRKCIAKGLSKEDALKAMTFTPAEMLKATNQMGSLEAGRVASFIISTGDIFDAKSKVLHTWSKGKASVFTSLDQAEVEGKYTIKIGQEAYDLSVKGNGSSAKFSISDNDSTKFEVKPKISGKLISLVIQKGKNPNRILLSGALSKNKMRGSGTLENGEQVFWEANRIGNVEEEKDERKKPREKKKDEIETASVLYPFMSYGWKERPTAQNMLIKNATVWTNEEEGILENADVLIQNRKIAAVGKNLSAAGAMEIDAEGKHVTSGVIDEHSHIAISRGVNECTQSSTAEVRIGDVVNSEDINIYRQLAGGVTVSHLLHGSCNPVGGQSAIIKLRWGFAPEEMKMKSAKPFIKFALGENVKRSSWNNNDRFPNTRMGVEQVYMDIFTRAQDYKKQTGLKRRDLDLETVNEILDSKRFISCHSYVQSEINMLMHVADKFGFTVNTFTHILEGYKVADKMAKHGAGGSSFSDWWSYKYEVIDAIPYNGAIMHEQGVVTAFNSDDAEMARRLNQEAGKAVLYGKVPEEEAWKFVTLNPAKLLRIDDQVGSIKKGKDADIVIWSDHPMSIYAKAEKTIIDGTVFFDREADKKKQKEIEKERNRLIQKMLQSKDKGGRQKVGRPGMRHYHCDDADDEMSN